MSMMPRGVWRRSASLGTVAPHFSNHRIAQRSSLASPRVPCMQIPSNLYEAHVVPSWKLSRNSRESMTHSHLGQCCQVWCQTGTRIREGEGEGEGTQGRMKEHNIDWQKTVVESIELWKLDLNNNVSSPKWKRTTIVGFYYSYMNINITEEKNQWKKINKIQKSTVAMNWQFFACVFTASPSAVVTFLGGALQSAKVDIELLGKLEKIAGLIILTKLHLYYD